jgi:hypothetical protein
MTGGHFFVLYLRKALWSFFSAYIYKRWLLVLTNKFFFSLFFSIQTPTSYRRQGMYVLLTDEQTNRRKKVRKKERIDRKLNAYIQTGTFPSCLYCISFFFFIDKCHSHHQLISKIAFFP